MNKQSLVRMMKQSNRSSVSTYSTEPNPIDETSKASDQCLVIRSRRTNVIAKVISSKRKRVFSIRMSDGSWLRVMKIVGYILTILLLLVIISYCPKAQSLAVVGHISSSAANMAAAAASLLVAQGLQLDQQQLAGAKKSTSDNQQQYRLTFEPITTNATRINHPTKENGSGFLNAIGNRTGSEQMYAERRNFGQRLPAVHNISESILGHLMNPMNVSLSAGSSEGNSSSRRSTGGTNSRLNLITRLLQYRLHRPNHSSLLGNIANKLSGSNLNSSSTIVINSSNGTSSHQPHFIDGEIGDTRLRDLQANSSVRDYQVVKLAQERQPSRVTLEVNGSSPDSWQETNNIEKVIKVRHEGQIDKEEEAAMSNKSDGGKMRGQFGTGLHGHEEAALWTKHKHGEQRDQGAGGRSTQQGDKWLKDSGHKRHGWKNVYHKEEYAQHQKFHDLMESKDAHDKLNADEEREHYDDGSKFNDTKTGSYYDKEKYGSKYDYVKGSNWKRQEEDQDQKHVANSKSGGGFGLKQHVSRKQDLDGNPTITYEESSSNDSEYQISPTTGPEQQEQQDSVTTSSEQDSEAPIEQMKDKLERLSAFSRYQAEKRLNSTDSNNVQPDIQVTSEQANYAASSPTSVSNEQDYDEDRDWSAANELGSGGRQHESINDILKTAKAMRTNQSSKSRVSHPTHQLNPDDLSFKNSSSGLNGQASGSASHELEPEDEEGTDQETDAEQEVGSNSNQEKLPKKNEQIRLKLELDLGKSMAPGLQDSGKGVGLGVRGRPAQLYRNHTYVSSANSARSHHLVGQKTGGNGGGGRHFVPAGGNLSLAESWPAQRPPMRSLHVPAAVLAVPQQQVLRQQPIGFSTPHFKRGQQFHQQHRASNESKWSRTLGGPNIQMGPSRYPTEAGRYGLQDGQLAGYRGHPPTRRPILTSPSIVNQSTQNSAIRMAVQGPLPSVTEWYPPHPAQRHPPIMHHSIQQPQTSQTNLLELSQALPNRPIYVKHLQMNGGVVLGRIQSSNRSVRTIIPEHHPLNLMPSQMLMDHHQSGQTIPLGLAEDLPLETSLNHALGDHHLLGGQPTDGIDQFNRLESAPATSQPLQEYLVGVAEMNGGRGSQPHELAMSIDGAHQMAGLMDMENLLGEADSQQLILAYNNNNNENEHLHQQPDPGFAQGTFLFQEPLDQFVSQSSGNTQQVLAHQQLSNPYAAMIALNQHPVQESSPNPGMLELGQHHPIAQPHLHQQPPQGLAMIPAMQHTFGRLFRLSRVFGGPAAFSAHKQQLLPAVQFHDFHSLQRQFKVPTRSAAPTTQRTPLLDSQQVFGNVRFSQDRWRPPSRDTVNNRNYALAIHPSLNARPHIYTRDQNDLISDHSKLMPASVYTEGRQVVPVVDLNPNDIGTFMTVNKTSERQRYKAPMRMRPTEKLMTRKTRPKHPASSGQLTKPLRSEANHNVSTLNLSIQHNLSPTTQATLTTSQISITQRPHLLGNYHQFQQPPTQPALVTTGNPIESTSPFRVLIPEQESGENLASWLNIPYVSRKPIPMHFVGSHNHNHNRFTTRTPTLMQTTAHILSDAATTTTNLPKITTVRSSTSRAPFFGQRILANFKSKFSNVAAG